MRIAVLIPDRGDRPHFLENCRRMMRAQTLQPALIHVVSFPPENEQRDITKRYRIGYDFLRNQQFDLIAWIENDDWYHPEYLQVMADFWYDNNRPDVLGTNRSIYYHIGLKKYKTLRHFSRSAAMNTFIKPDLDVIWPKDSEPYTDVYLYHHNPLLTKVIIDPVRTISMGIKHAVGLCGGEFHSSWLDRFDITDTDFKFLLSVMDEPSADFYIRLHESIKSNQNIKQQAS